MYNMFDILQSQGDAGVRAFGQQFGLSPEQTRSAMEALLPALTLGLQRNAGLDPMGFGRLFGLGAAGGPQRPSTPPDLISGLFGSPTLGQAVIQQAAAASGVGAQALRQMLPIMAGMIVAGIVHLLLNPPAAAPAAEPAPAPLPMGHLWSDWLNGLTAAASAQVAAPPPPSRPQVRQEPPQAAPSPDAAKVSMEVISQMLQTGAEVQEQNVKAMKEVFDAFWSAPRESAGPVPGAEDAPPKVGSSAGPAENANPAPAPRRKPGGKA